MSHRKCAGWVLGVTIKFENTTGKYHVYHAGMSKSRHDEEWQANAAAERLADILWDEMHGIER